MRIAALILVLATAIGVAQPAQADETTINNCYIENGQPICGTTRSAYQTRAGRSVRFASPAVRSSGGCPSYLGCACHLAVYLGLGNRRDLWYARNFSRQGTAANKGCVGCVAVLSRGKGGHVGVVRSYDANGNPVIYSWANARLGWTETSYDVRRVLAYRYING